MNHPLNPGDKANLRLNHINGDIAEIKTEQKEQGVLIRLTREDMASLKTEVRIVGGIVLSAVIIMIGIYLRHIIT